MDRPEFDKLKSVLQSGDKLIVTKLDRFARSAAQGSQLIESLIEQGITVHVLNIGVMDNARGTKLVGTMPNNEGVSGEISVKDGAYSIPIGFHDGSGKVAISSTEQAKIIAGNIKQGITILGVAGSYSGEGVKAQSKIVTPSKTQQTVQPDNGYDYLSSVTVNAIPYTETDNSAGGKTVTIG